MIPALVLTAGLATRLRPLSYVRAKAALPLGDQAIVQRILRWLAAYGVADAVLNLHHLPHTIARIVGDGAGDGLAVRYSWEVPVLGSAGGPRRALPLLGSSPFLIVNGDTLTDLDLNALVAEHRRSGALVTMAVIRNTEPDKYGGVVVEGTEVRGFVKAGSSQPSYHFIGVQVAEAAVFEPLPRDTPSESVAQVYPALIASHPGSVRAFISAAQFFDIGTPSDYLSTCLRFAPRPDECAVWEDVDIHPTARLRRCVVTDHVRVPAGAVWENMTIRVADGESTKSERQVGDLAIGPIDGTTSV